MERWSRTGRRVPYAWARVCMAEVELYSWVGMYIGEYSVMRERSGAGLRLLHYDEDQNAYFMRPLLADEVSVLVRGG